MLRFAATSERSCLRQATSTSSCPVFAFRAIKLNKNIFQYRKSTPLRAQPEQQAPPKPAAQDEALPPWVRRERERELQAKQGISGLPWPLFLLFSIFTAIAAVGSIFELIDGNPIFGVLPPDNPLWAPILLFFAVTGFPTAGYLFIRGVNGFNDEAERQDKLDGYL